MNAAIKLGIPFKYYKTNASIGYFFKNQKRLFMLNNIPGINNYVSSYLALNKYKTKQVFSKANIPHPKAKLFKSNILYKNIFNKIKDLKRPTVVKPLKGFGGDGVYVNLLKDNEIRKSISLARNYYPIVLVEEFIEGEDYRIVVLNNQVIDIVKRIPANVTSDGVNTIENLIRKKNKFRKKYYLQPIKIDFLLKKFIKKQGLTLTSIPPKNITILLRENCNMSSGGDTVRIPLIKVHKDNILMFLKSAEVLGLDFAGIDFITPDISKSYKHIHSGINEMNKSPMPGANYYADLKMNNFVCEEVLKYYFKL
jgi:cyanophycin synthetase